MNIPNRSSLKRTISLLTLIMVIAINLKAQNTAPDSAKIKRFDVFPAISYSPETKLTLGALGYWYLNAANKDKLTGQSYLNFLALYTLANQILIESNWDIFTNDNKVRFQGGLEYSRYPNRNYGLGNDADARVIEYSLNEGQVVDSALLNYKRYSIERLNFRPVVLWQLVEHLYVGLNADLEYVWNFKELADSTRLLQGSNSIEQLEANTLGWRSGLGLNLVYDSRDYILSATQGSFINFNGSYYGGYLGSDYDYLSILIDARTYLKSFERNTLALRGLVNFKSTAQESLPLRGISKVGGSNLLRGYFNGTFQNNNLVAIESEYRIPFWREDNLGPIYHYWKRLALTIFFSGAQVFGPEKSTNGFDFNFAGGAGLRILFNEKSRSYLRMDYSFGFTPEAGGPGKFQRGFYFTFGEAF